MSVERTGSRKTQDSVPTVMNHWSELGIASHGDTPDNDIHVLRKTAAQMSIVIIADDPNFARAVVDRWHMERIVPAITVVSTTVWRGAEDNVDLAILGPERLARLLPLAEKFDGAGTTTLCVVDDAAVVDSLRERFPRLLVLPQHDGWPDALVLVGSEVLRRVEATERAQAAGAEAAAAQRQALLGRYVLDMRHSLNNALTSVLGNAELLLLDAATMSADMRDQVETIHCMALRMHELIQRFSSLDAELQFTEKRSQPEKAARAEAGVCSR